MTAKSSTLDLNGRGSTDQRDELLWSFDALANGESFTLLAAKDPRSLLVALQEKRPGLFDWDFLEAGPIRYRVEVTRRPPDGARNVTELLRHEHVRLDELLARASDLIDRELFSEAGRRFAELRCGLERHMGKEEDVLLPKLGKLAGLDPQAPIQVRADHAKLRELLKEGADSLSDGDEVRFRALAGEIRFAMDEHDAKEGDALSLLIDAELGTDEAREALVRRLQLY